VVDILGPRRCRSVWPGTLLAIAIVGLEPCGQVHCEAVISVMYYCQRTVVSTSNLVETFIVRYASRDTLSMSVGQLDRK